MEMILGGFTAIRVASFYPLLKGLVLDATFDDVLCIAKYLLPSYAGKLFDKLFFFNLALPFRYSFCP